MNGAKKKQIIPNGNFLFAAFMKYDNPIANMSVQFVSIRMPYDHAPCHEDILEINNTCRVSGIRKKKNNLLFSFDK